MYLLYLHGIRSISIIIIFYNVKHITRINIYNNILQQFNSWLRVY